MTTIARAAEPCGCGCCGDVTTHKSKEQEVAELTSLRAAIDSRLSELGA